MIKESLPVELTVRYRGKPLRLKLIERIEDIDYGTFIPGEDNSSVTGICRLVGNILWGEQEDMTPGSEFRVRTRDLRCRFIVGCGGQIRSNGVYFLKALHND